MNHKRGDAVAVQETEMGVLERESLTSLQDPGRSDRWIVSSQEGKLFYAARTTRGLQDREFLQTP